MWQRSVQDCHAHVFNVDAMWQKWWILSGKYVYNSHSSCRGPADQWPKHWQWWLTCLLSSTMNDPYQWMQQHCGYKRKHGVFYLLSLSVSSVRRPSLPPKGPSVPLSACLPICMSVRPFVCLPVRHFICTVCSLHPSASPSVYSTVFFCLLLREIMNTYQNFKHISYIWKQKQEFFFLETERSHMFLKTPWKKPEELAIHITRSNK